MKRIELVQMLDPVKFRDLLAKAKISEKEKAAIIRDRSRWLWETYRPEKSLNHEKRCTV